MMTIEALCDVEPVRFISKIGDAVVMEAPPGNVVLAMNTLGTFWCSGRSGWAQVAIQSDVPPGFVAAVIVVPDHLALSTVQMTSASIANVAAMIAAKHGRLDRSVMH